MRRSEMEERERGAPVRSRIIFAPLLCAACCGVVRGFAYLKQRRYEEATAMFQKAVELSGRASRHLGNLGYCYAVTGRRAEALRILKELEEKYARHESIGLYLAGVYAGLNNRDQTFVWLERDFEQRSGQLPVITWRFPFEDLRA